MNICVIGSMGRLGSEIVSELKNEGDKVFEVDLKGEIKCIDLLETEHMDGIIDVSCAKNSINTAKFAQRHHLPIAIGCTGHNEDELKEINSCSFNIPILLCYNFSFGISAFKIALEKLLSFSPKSVYMHEIHHKLKKDSPSGTAKEIEKIIKDYDINFYPTVSIRESTIIGKHSLEIYFENEVITLTHEAISRKAFSSGAVKALKILVSKKNGLYSLKDLMEN